MAKPPPLWASRGIREAHVACPLTSVAEKVTPSVVTIGASGPLLLRAADGADTTRSGGTAGLPEGLFVQAVTPGGPAAAAGLRPEDVITKIDGEQATSNIQLEELTLTKKLGDTVSIDYTRGRPVGHGDGHPDRATMICSRA